MMTSPYLGDDPLVFVQIGFDEKIGVKPEVAIMDKKFEGTVILFLLETASFPPKDAEGRKFIDWKLSTHFDLCVCADSPRLDDVLAAFDRYVLPYGSPRIVAGEPATECYIGPLARVFGSQAILQGPLIKTISYSEINQEPWTLGVIG